jgi:hypothetical protein
MAWFLLGGILFLLAYAPLRTLKDRWEREELQSSSRFTIGVLAWASVAALLMTILGFFQPIVGMFTRPEVGQGLEIGSLALAVTGIARLNVSFPELLDIARMRPFFLGALRFSDPGLSRMIMVEELDKHQIRTVYREVTGRELPEKVRPRKSAWTPERAERELAHLRNRQTITPHLQDELRLLKSNKPADITDSWRINSLRRSSHDFFRRVQRVMIEPGSGTLSLDVDFGDVDPRSLQTSTGVFRFYQDLYDFLQAMREEVWMQPYMPLVKSVSLAGSRVEYDEFGQRRDVLFLRMEATVEALERWEGRFFNPAELNTIARIEFKNGEAVA